MTHKKKMQKKDKHEDFESLYKRALADYQNLQKQTAKEKEEFARYVKGNLIMEFIPVYENLKSAVEHAQGGDHDLSAQAGEWLKGVQYVIKQFEDILANNNVQIIDPVDEEFNPQEHEAVEKVLTEDEKQINKISKVIKLGYKLNDHVLQPAKVVVYSEKSKQ